MYALIYKSGNFLGVFSSKAKMKQVIEMIIKGSYEDTGYHGNYNFRWVKLNVDEPWFTPSGVEPSKESQAIFSLHTMNTEKFIHKVMTDWSTGKILNMDANDTTNVNER